MSSLEDKGLVPPGTSPAGTPKSAPTLPSAILEKAADLIAQPGAWTQGDFARDKAGRSVRTNGPEAVCWCAWGAVLRVLPYEDYDANLEWRTVAFLQRVTGSITEWNDTPERTQAEAVAGIHKAAALAREQGQ